MEKSNQSLTCSGDRIRNKFHFFRLEFLSVILVVCLQCESEIVVKRVMSSLSKQQVTSSNFFMEVISVQNVKFAERAGSID